MFLGHEGHIFKGHFLHVVAELELDPQRISNGTHLWNVYSNYDRNRFKHFMEHQYEEDYLQDTQAGAQELNYLILAIAIELCYLAETGKRVAYMLNVLEDIAEFCNQHQVDMPWGDCLRTIAKMSQGTRFNMATESNTPAFVELVKRYDGIITNREDWDLGDDKAHMTHFFGFITILSQRFQSFDINQRITERNRTLLMELACNNVNDYTVRNLIALGADPELRDDSGMKAIHMMDLSQGTCVTCISGFHPSINKQTGYDCDIFETVHYIKDYPDIGATLQCSSLVDEMMQYEKEIGRTGMYYSGNIYDYIQRRVNDIKAMSAAEEHTASSSSRKTNHL